MLGQLTDPEIDLMLRTQWVARLGIADAPAPYVVPINYAYDGQALYGHSNEGRKLRLMRANPQVCVQLDDVRDIAHWKSVIAWGRFEELSGHDAEHGMQLLVERFKPLMAEQHTVPTHWRPGPDEADQSIPPAIVYRIVLGKRSGRFEQK